MPRRNVMASPMAAQMEGERTGAGAYVAEGKGSGREGWPATPAGRLAAGSAQERRERTPHPA